MRVLILGDIGSPGNYHLGDEAMAEALACALNVDGDVEVIAISGDEASTRSRYGWQTAARFGFAALGTDWERDARLDAIGLAASGASTALAWNDPAWEVIHAISSADAVVISGGGNLNSTWPEHIYERAATAQVAVRSAIPYAITGQSIGPHLTGRHGQLVAEILGRAVLVGVREATSHGIARRLGAPADRLAHTIDDAAHLDFAQVSDPLPAGPYIAATFAPHGGLAELDSLIASAAVLFDDLAELTDWRVVLVPHESGSPGSQRIDDRTVHQAIANSVTRAQVDVLDTVTARHAAKIVASARLVLSTRYHPVVFGMANGVPALGICVDAYTSNKIRGALENYGCAPLAVSVASLVRGELGAIARDVIAREGEIRRHLDKVRVVRRREQEAWWRALRTAVTSPGTAAPELQFAEVPLLWNQSPFPVATALRDWSAEVSARIEADALTVATIASAGETADLLRRIEELRLQRDDLATQLSAERDQVLLLRATAAELEHAGHEARATATRLRAELDALYATRSYRYLAPVRRFYSKLRQR